MIEDEEAIELAEQDEDFVLVEDGSPTTSLSDGSPLILRSYRNVCSTFLRKSLIQRDAAIPARILMEINLLKSARMEALERRGVLLGQFDEVEKPEPSLSGELAILNERIAQQDSAIGLWCDRLNITVFGGDYLLDNDGAFAWVKLLYSVGVEDTEMVFRDANAWNSVVSCMVEIGARRVKPYVGPSSGYWIDWRPLHDLIQKTLHAPVRIRDSPALRSIQEKVRSVMSRLCITASEQFNDKALEELWDLFSPSFRPDGTAAMQSLAYFAALAPPFQLLQTPRQTELVSFIIDFLFCKSQTWHQSSANWGYFAFHFLNKLTPMSLASQGLCKQSLDVDAIAEPIFSSIFYCLRLPVGDSDVRRAIRVGGKASIEMLMPMAASSVLQRKHCVIADFFPDNNKSPLWNQFRRLIRATEVFLRPNATVIQGSQQLSSLLGLMTTQMVRRIERQRRLQRLNVESSWYLSQGSIDEFARLVLPPLCSALYSKSKSIATDAQLAMQAMCRIAPEIAFPEVVRYSSLGFAVGAEQHQLGIALELFGNAVPELLLAHYERNGVASPCVSSSTTEVQGAPSEGNQAPVWEDQNMPMPLRVIHFLYSISERILPLIDSNDITKTMLATRLVFQSAVFFGLRGTCLPPPHRDTSADGTNSLDAGSLEMEQSFLVSLTDRLLTFSNHCEGVPKKLAAAYFASVGAIFVATSTPTMTCIAERVCRKLLELGQSAAVYPLSALLQAIATVCPEQCWKAMFPTILQVLTDPISSLNEIRWYSNLLVGLLLCKDRTVIFSRRLDIDRIVKSLLIRLTNRDRVFYAGLIYETLVFALLRRVPAPTCKSGGASSIVSENAGTYVRDLLDGKPVRIVAAREAKLVWSESRPEDIAFCVSMSNAHFEERLNDLVDLDGAVRRRIDAYTQFVPATHNQQQPIKTSTPNAGEATTSPAGAQHLLDEDEPLHRQSIMRNTLRWIRKITEVNSILFASDRSTEATREIEKLKVASIAPHLLSQRKLASTPSICTVNLPLHGGELTTHACDLIRAILNVLPLAVGSDNYVATQQPPSLACCDLLARGVGEGDVKSLRYCLKTLSFLCSLNSTFDLFSEPVRVLLVNWKSQFSFANGTRRMPHFFWQLYAEIQEEDSRGEAQIDVLNGDVTDIAKAAMQIACHHRYAEAQAPARALFSNLAFVEGPTQELTELTNAVIDDLRTLSVVAARLLESGAIAATNTYDGDENTTDSSDIPDGGAQTVSRGITSRKLANATNQDVTTTATTVPSATPANSDPKRFDHEASGILQTLCQTWVLRIFFIPSSSKCVSLADLLLEFPDVLLPTEEALRKGLFRAICTERQLRATSELSYAVPQVLDRAFRMAPSIPSRAAKWLELLSSLWRPGFPQLSRSSLSSRGWICMAVAQQLLRLSLSDHLRLRSMAVQLLSMSLSCLTMKHTKRLVPLVANSNNSDSSFTEKQQARQTAFHCGRVPMPIYGLQHVGQFFLPDQITIVECSKDEGASLKSDMRAALGRLIFGNPSATAEDDVKATWVWQVVQRYQDEAKQYRALRMHFWKLLGRVCGPMLAVRVYRQVCDSLVEQWKKAISCESASNSAAMERAKESHKGLISVVSELCSASLRCTKYAADGSRQCAMEFFTETLRLVVSPQISHEVLASMLRVIMDLHDIVSVEEVQEIFRLVLDLLEEKLTTASSSTKGSNTSNHSHSVSANSANSSAPASSSSSASSSSQDSIRVLTILLQLLNTFSHDIITPVMPFVLQRVTQMRNLMLQSPLSQVRNHTASVLRQLLQCALFAKGKLTTSPSDPQSDCSDLVASLVHFSTCLLDGALTDKDIEQKWPVTPRTSSDTDANADVDVDVSPEVLCACKANIVLWAYPSVPLLPTMYPRLLKFTAAVMDIRLAEADDIINNAYGTLVSAAFTRVEKTTALLAIETCANILLGAYTFGRGRQAMIMICRTLRVLLYVNMHRVGKFQTMQKMTEAALQCVSHADKRVRSEGKTLFSVIVRVASEEQIGAIVKDMLRRLRAEEQIQEPNAASAPSTVTPGVSPAMSPVTEAGIEMGEGFQLLRSPVSAGLLLSPTKVSKKLPLCVALCGAVLADPDSVPVYVPRVLERLACYARDRNPDVSSTVRQTLMEWWASHRDKWSFCHSKHFSEGQLKVLMELFTAPNYYV